ncbi:hypothetical protein C5Y96_04610 [Blastopirellula marina]|uniref:Uncharacterized protein n=1 Tax=Blastopirellula marina TaxID=124 RepID=A0A2S8G3W7_9BACT|nr:MULTISPECIES: hypothetical protein [Pirellulaceae]PQO39149.1 hypothetical protein C5Y96_04610 [Blastopirellula marina]RCS55457.1 hypothetical protein DTL36_04620 [Bremerella cremea]
MLHLTLITVALAILLAVLGNGIRELFAPHAPSEEPFAKITTRIGLAAVGGIITLLCATLPWIIASL